ncbi:MAG TPA: HAD-IA family hydrolase, partial [Spongiibacteraceae bacterium]|nr:HAD-IA family hydrolase [Spongiibacteraceae bacterium]
STGRIIGAMQCAIAELGFAPRSDAEVRDIIGLGLPEAIEQLFPTVSASERAVLQASYARHYVAADQQPCAFFPGAVAVLEQLKMRGHLMAIATGKSRKGMRRVLDQLDMHDFFHATRCADETRSKPHPQMLHELLTELAVPTHSAVMIGDTEYDMAMARNAGMARIAVKFGAHVVERLTAYEPELILDDWHQLLAWPAVRVDSPYR